MNGFFFRPDGVVICSDDSQSTKRRSKRSRVKRQFDDDYDEDGSNSDWDDWGKFENVNFDEIVFAKKRNREKENLKRESKRVLALFVFKI